MIAEPNTTAGVWREQGFPPQRKQNAVAEGGRFVRFGSSELLDFTRAGAGELTQKIQWTGLRAIHANVCNLA